MHITRFHNLLLYGFIATLIYFPLAFGSTRAMYAAPGQVMLQLITIGSLVYLWRFKPALPKAFSAARLPIALLVAFLLLQIVLHLTGIHFVDEYGIREQLVKTLCLIQIFCLMLFLADTRQRLKFVVTALVLSGVFQAVYGTLMTVTGTEYIWNQPKADYRGVATGTFVARTHLAGYLEMTLSLGIGLLIANLVQGNTRTWRQRLRQWTNTLLGEKARVRLYLALMVIGLILTHSRMGNTAFFSAMLVSGGLGLFLFRRSSKGVIVLFSSLLIIDLFLMGSFFGIEKVQQRIDQTSLEETRFEANKLSLLGIQDNLALGTGLGTWYATFPEYRESTIVGFYRHVHSDLIEFPSETGSIGVVLLAVFSLLSFHRAIRVQLNRRDQLLRAMGFASMMATISILVHSAVDFNLQILANSATFMVVLSLPWMAQSINRR
jgi:hypothetical protein